MENFYTTKPIGGMGNQMFMIAHAIAQGLKHNVPVMFATDDWLCAEARGQHVDYRDSIFQKVPKVKSLPPAHKISEHHWNYPRLKFDPNMSIEFFGYFQSSKNFLGFDDKIRELYSPTNEDVQKYLSLFPDLKNENTLSVHVRRQDYLWHSHILPPVDISYYKEAIRQCEYDTLFIFSDDKEWAKQNFKYPNTIIINTNLMDHEEMWVMSLCSNNIICNSTFGWWGAFLNKNINKKVFVPSIWFGIKGPHPFHNIFMDDWIQIKVQNKKNILYYY